MNKRKWNRLSMLAAAVFMTLAVLWPGGKVQAANPTGWTLPISIGMSGDKLTSTKTIEVEVGQKFYISDFLIEMQCNGVYPTPVSPDWATYSTSNKKIAQISKGCVTTKKVGTAKITAKFEKKKYVCTLKVVNKGKLGSTTTYKRMNTLAKKLEGYYSKKINSDNFLTLAKAAIEYRNLADANKKKLNGDRGYILKTSKLAVPLASRIAEVERKLKEYATDCIYDKMDDASARISSVTAKSGGNTFTVTLKKKLSQKEFYLLALGFSDHLDYGETKVTFGAKPCITVKTHLFGHKSWITVDEFGDETEESQDSSGYVIYTLKPGTAKISATLYKNSKCTKTLKLIKGMEYEISCGDAESEEGSYFFKAK